ncbi:MAG: bifunctional diaminohydroxyphosphoribosylaminopyrimidine [Pseudomonadota bacterium]|jgi:diaminohydroxyphosphoribosylaminopyrimidine deaminase/5-amino-6-(5-phosphoribosylamino)uracil reductase
MLVMHIANDMAGMRAALDEARKGLYITTPNPRVGCVIARDGHVIACGHTQPAGQAHAEVHALQDAAARGVDVRGATAYVTLEPCSHHGRTPPCCDALVAAGIARVVTALEDPNPLVAGQGVARLRAAGITVDIGVLGAEAADLNIGFLHRMKHGRPWVRMKIAASLDGGTALPNGASQWITSAAARDDGHAWRAQACAILTGIGTVQQDDPQLNVRAVDTPRQPRRIIVDSKLDIAPSARVLDGGGSWIFAARHDEQREAVLRAAGNEVIVLPNRSGKVDLDALMRELGRRQINELHVEAGTKLNGSLLRAGCVNELLLYVAPCLLGPAQGLANLPELQDLSGRIGLEFIDVARLGPDLRLRARVLPRPGH